MAERLRELTIAYFKVWNSHDEAGIEALHAEKSTLKDWNAEHGPTRADVAKGIAGIWKDVPAIKIEIADLFTSVTNTCVASIRVVVDATTTLKVTDVIEYDDAGLVVRLDAYLAQPKPKVLFVLGGPGAGKGTQCAKIVEEFADWAHVSAGDCLRAERQDPNSKDGELIEKIIKEGKIVPVAITVKLLQKAMTASKKSCFLIDGFPRNLDNVTGWKENVGELGAQVCGVLYYEAQEDELEKRLLSRGETSGRSDDNIESIRKRFKTYIGETMPIIDEYKSKNMVFTVNGMPPADEVWKVTQGIIKQVEAMPPM
jgi:UMP-CMP kinase